MITQIINFKITNLIQIFKFKQTNLKLYTDKSLNTQKTQSYLCIQKTQSHWLWAHTVERILRLKATCDFKNTTKNATCDCEHTTERSFRIYKHKIASPYGYFLCPKSPMGVATCRQLANGSCNSPLKLLSPPATLQPSN